MEDILFNLVPNLKDATDDFKAAVLRRYKEFITYSQIPNKCYGFTDQSIIPSKLFNVFKNMEQAVADRYNFYFDFADYKNLEYLAYLMLQSYFKQCVLEDKLVEDILYIDTKLLVEDYKRLIDYKEEKDSLKPIHDLKILYAGIENAPLVIWDKFTLLDSYYDRDKIYDIINIRQRRGLGNFYFSMGGKQNFVEKIGQNTAALIQLDLGFDLSTTTINLESTKEVGLFK